MKVTFGSILERTAGIGLGFDTMRLLLSISILCWHSVSISYGKQVELNLWSSPYGTVVSTVLPVFFVLSGFLVMGSASRAQSLRAFLTLRALRIVPALATEITLSALIIGATLTTLPLPQYLSSGQFYAYFGSLIGRIRVTLPGVFEHNPLPDLVNQSLWTIGPELLCYVYLAALITAGIARHRALTTIVGCTFVVLDFVRDQIGSYHHIIGEPLLPRSLLVSFILGNMAYLWREKLPYSWMLFTLNLIIGIGTIHLVHWEDIGIVSLTYCTVFLGLTPIKKIPVLSRGDYSYGIYLYAFAIQQAVSYLLPEAREFYWNILISLPIAILLAMGSWRFIEKPTLSLRKRLTGLSASRPQQSASQEFIFTFVALFLLLFYGAFLATNAKVIPEKFVLSGPNASVLVAAIVLAAAAGACVKWMLSANRPSMAWNGSAMNLAMSRSERK